MFKSFLNENFNAIICDIIMQGSPMSVDSKLLKPIINHGPILVLQKDVKRFQKRENLLHNRMLQGTVVRDGM